MNPNKVFVTLQILIVFNMLKVYFITRECNIL